VVNSKNRNRGGSLMELKVTYLIVILLCNLSFGGEFQVNTHTSNDQRNAAVAMDVAGNFVVVWSSYSQDGSSNGIFGRRFDPNCNPIVEEFQINAITSGNQTEPSVAMNDDGDFVVVWQGPGLTEGDEEDIFAQRFDANGLPVGDEFMVNIYTSYEQLYPSVAMNNDGAFVIVWEAENVPEEGDRAICGQLYDSTGEKLADEFIVNEEPSDCRTPDVAMDPNGGCVIVWMHKDGGNSIMARMFNADGSARTDAFEINTISFSSNSQAAIAMNAAGDFVVTWDGDPSRAGDDDIHARLFDPNGTPLGEQFVVNTILDNAQQNPQVAMNNAGEFVIVWDNRIDPNVNERDICGQRFDSNGEPIGDEFLINTHLEDDQRCPDVVISENGCFVTVWQSDNEDGSGFGIFGCAGPIIDSNDLNVDDVVDSYDYFIPVDE
jgi:hypothetical protein